MTDTSEVATVPVANATGAPTAPTSESGGVRAAARVRNRVAEDASGFRRRRDAPGSVPRSVAVGDRRRSTRPPSKGRAIAREYRGAPPAGRRMAAAVMDRSCKRMSSASSRR